MRTYGAGIVELGDEMVQGNGDLNSPRLSNKV